VESGRLHLTVLSAAPAPRTGAASPWAGMSGAGLVVGPYLVGVVVVDPARYGTDRLVAVPVARMLAAAGFRAALGEWPDPVPVGAAWRLEYAADRSLTLAAPYRPLPANLNVAAARTRLLYPEHGVVPFSGRADLVGGLAAWCTAGGPGLAVQTVTGAGGSGKTRLAAEACVALAGQGWDAGFADLDRPGGAVRWQLDRPTLLVVDNADLNIGLAADLVTSLAYTDVPVRLLLLARSRAPWWQQLGTATEQLVDGFDNGDLPLSAHRLDLPARAAHYRAAFDALARALTGPNAPPGVVSDQPDLAADAFGDPLMVHLLALLAASGDPLSLHQRSDRPERPIVLRAVLDREAARWPQQLRAEEDLVEGPVVLRRCVATSAVSSPAEEAPAAAMLAAVPDLAVDSEAGRRRTLARWLHWLHPGVDYWNPIRPDPLADQLLADLEVLPELVISVADQAIQLGDWPTVDRLLAELTRAAAAAGGSAAAALSMLLPDRMDILLETTLARPDSPLPQRLVAALQQAPAPAAAAAVVNRLPKRSLAHADLAAEITTQAVGHYRALAAARPDAFLPDLAGALNNQSSALALGRREDALTAITEAVGHYRALAAARPDAFLPDITKSLNNQSNRLADLGRREDALTAIEEAVQIRRVLADKHPVFLETLARSLTS